MDNVSYKGSIVRPIKGGPETKGRSRMRMLWMGGLVLMASISLGGCAGKELRSGTDPKAKAYVDQGLKMACRDEKAECLHDYWKKTQSEILKASGVSEGYKETKYIKPEYEQACEARHDRCLAVAHEKTQQRLAEERRRLKASR